MKCKIITNENSSIFRRNFHFGVGEQNKTLKISEMRDFRKNVQTDNQQKELVVDEDTRDH